MVKYLLKISEKLDNATDLQPRGGCDSPDFCFYLKLKCVKCGEVSSKEACLSLSDVIPHRRTTVNLKKKCKFCGMDGTVTMISGKGRPLTEVQSRFRHYTPLMVFDCCGIEPLDFSFASGWQVYSIKGKRMDVDLTGGSFAANEDEEEEDPVKISNLRSAFDRHLV